MVDESSAAAEVKLISKRTYMNKMGLIFTEHNFQILEGYNLEGDTENDILKIELTGGTINGVTSYIDGAPEFSVGEKSFLLLKKLENKMYISNFTLGKYRVVQDGDKTVYVSSVFPNDPEMGNVAKEKMIELIKEKFKISNWPAKKEEVQKVSWAPNKVEPKFSARWPAQVQPPEKKDFPYMLMILTIATFIISGIIGYRVFKKEK